MRRPALDGRWRRGTAALGALALLACGPSGEVVGARDHRAEALADQEDEVCGMLVREQSAPRAQVVHRDGTRFFFCSLGDMLVHLSAPSPHGRSEAIFVELMSPEEDPLRAHTGEHPWVRAEDAFYVVGIERPGVMGAPVLTYAHRSDAERVSGEHPGAQILDLAGLRAWWKELEAAR